MNRLTSRKFLLALLTLVSASLLCWYGHIADGVYSAVVIATVGAYIAGNVMQKQIQGTTNTGSPP
jgi:hypothetical protein